MHNEAELIDLIDQYQAASVAYKKAKATLDTLKESLKGYGTMRVGGYTVDVTVVERETISWAKIKELSPQLASQIIELGLVNKSSSELLTVKLKGD